MAMPLVAACASPWPFVCASSAVYIESALVCARTVVGGDVERGVEEMRVGGQTERDWETIWRREWRRCE
jgi:hypothetical protein